MDPPPPKIGKIQHHLSANDVSEKHNANQEEKSDESFSSNSSDHFSSEEVTSLAEKPSHFNDSESPSSSNVKNGPHNVDVISRSSDPIDLVHCSAFVDKTMVVKALFLNEDGNRGNMRKVLVTAPSRHGKTTIMTTVKRFLQILPNEKGLETVNVVYNTETKEWEEKPKAQLTKNYLLFTNLKIYRCHCKSEHKEEECIVGLCDGRRFFYKHCGTHPVIHIDFKNVECHSARALYSSLRSALYKMFCEHEYLSGHLVGGEKETFDKYIGSESHKKLSKEEVKNGLWVLTRILWKRFQKRVFVLIDEFDAPIITYMFSTEHSEEMSKKIITRAINVIGQIVSSVLKSTDDIVEGGLLNACFRLGQILSPYGTNVEDCMFMDNHDFAEFYGFTKAEVDVLFEKEQFRTIDRQAVDDYYNGYKIFGRDTSMYSIYSLTEYLKICVANQKRELQNPPPKGFWINRYGFQDFCNLLMTHDSMRNRFHELLIKSELEIAKPLGKVSIQDVLVLKTVINNYVIEDSQIDVFLGFLSDFGYLNVVRESNLSEKMVVRIPDREIFKHIFYQVQRSTLMKSRQLIDGVKIREFTDAVNLLQGKSIKSLQRFANSVANLYSDRRVPEPTSQVELQGLLFTLLLQAGEGETHAEMYAQMYRRFRLDNMIVRKDGSGIIIEIKVNYADSHSALKQIFTSEYHRAFDRYNIVKEKIYIGLLYANRQVTVSSVSTAADVKVNTFADFRQNEMIQLSSSL